MTITADTKYPGVISKYDRKNDRQVGRLSEV